MKQILSILLLLVVAGSASAQNMPERSLVRKGNRHYHKGKYESSITHYEAAVEAAPEQFEAVYNLGNALYKAERFDGSEKSLQKAAADTLRTEVERAESFYNLGNAQFKQEKYKEALESYKNSLRLNPSDQEAKYNYAYTKRLLEEQEQNQQNQDQNQDNQQDNQQEQNQDQQNQQQNQDNQQDQQNQDKGEQQEQNQDQPKPEQEQGEGKAQPQEGELSEQEQEQILDAIQAQEDKTQEKLKEKQGVIIRGNKNW